MSTTQPVARIKTDGLWAATPGLGSVLHRWRQPGAPSPGQPGRRTPPREDFPQAPTASPVPPSGRPSSGPRRSGGQRGSASSQTGPPQPGQRTTPPRRAVPGLPQPRPGPLRGQLPPAVAGLRSPRRYGQAQDPKPEEEKRAVRSAPAPDRVQHTQRFPDAASPRERTAASASQLTQSDPGGVGLPTLSRGAVSPRSMALAPAPPPSQHSIVGTEPVDRFAATRSQRDLASVSPVNFTAISADTSGLPSYEGEYGGGSGGGWPDSTMITAGSRIVDTPGDTYVGLGADQSSEFVVGTAPVDFEAPRNPLLIKSEEVYRTYRERHSIYGRNLLHSTQNTPSGTHLSAGPAAPLPLKLPAASRQLGKEAQTREPAAGPSGSPAGSSSAVEGFAVPRVRSSFVFIAEDAQEVCSEDVRSGGTRSPSPIMFDQSSGGLSVDTDLSRAVSAVYYQHAAPGTGGAPLRDWNSEFQGLIEQSALTSHELAERAARLKKFAAEFHAAVLPLARTIIEERHLPESHKTIPAAASADAGGKAGGDKYIYKGFFFKFTNTPTTERLYGSYPNAMKSASHERKGVMAISSCGVPRLRVPLTLVLTHLGQRLWVSTLVPVERRGPTARPGVTLLLAPPGDSRGRRTTCQVISHPAPNGAIEVEFEGVGRQQVTSEWWRREAAMVTRPCGCPNSLRYGCASAAYLQSPDRHGHAHADPEVHELMCKAAAVLNLKPHYVGPKTHGDLTLLAGPVDLEIHQCSSDGRFYVLDTARLFPPEPPCSRSSFLYRLLRPEHVRRCATPLSSDAFSGFGHHNRREHDEEVLRAAQELHREVIPRCATRFAHQLLMRAERTGVGDSGGAPHPSLRPPLPVTAVLHSHGINMRHLGGLLVAFRKYVAQHPLASSETRRVATSALVAEMCARAFKGVMWERHAQLPALPETAHAEAAAAGFSDLLHGGSGSGRFWREQLLPRLQDRFGCSSEDLEKLQEEIAFLGGAVRRARNVTLSKVDDGLLTGTFYFHIYSRACQLLGCLWRVDQVRLQQLGTGYGEPAFTPDLVSFEPVVKLNEVIPLAEAAGLEKQGCVEEAERLYQDEIAARVLVSGGDSEGTIPLLSSLAALYGQPQWGSSKRDEVLGLRKRVVKIYQDMRELDPAGAATTTHSTAYAAALDALGAEFERTGAFEEARDAFATAASVRVAVEGKLGMGAALGLHNAARVRAAMGKPREALGISERAVFLYERLYRESDSEEAAAALARAFEGHAELHATMGHWSAADKAATRALALRRQVLREGHPDIAASCAQQGVIAEAQCDMLRALEHTKEAVTMLEQSLSPSHPLTIQAVCQEARLLRKTAQFEEGRQRAVAGLNRAKKSRGKDSLEAKAAACTYARFVCDPEAELHGDARDAKTIASTAEVYDDAVAALQAHHGHTRLKQVVRWSARAGQCWQLQGDDDNAERRLLAAVKAADDLELDDAAARHALVALGRLRCKQGRHGEASDLYHRALAKAERAEGPDHREHAAVSQLETCTRVHQGQSNAVVPVAPRRARAAKLVATAALVSFLAYNSRIPDAISNLRVAVQRARALFPADADPDPLAAVVLRVIELAGERLGQAAPLQLRDEAMRLVGPGGEVETLLAAEQDKQQRWQDERREHRKRQSAQAEAEERAELVRRTQGTLGYVRVYIGRQKYAEGLPLLESALRGTGRGVLIEDKELCYSMIGAAEQIAQGLQGGRQDVYRRAQEVVLQLRSLQGPAGAPARAAAALRTGPRRRSSVAPPPDRGGAPAAGDRRRQSVLQFARLPLTSPRGAGGGGGAAAAGRRRSSGAAGLQSPSESPRSGPSPPAGARAGAGGRRNRGGDDDRKDRERSGRGRRNRGRAPQASVPTPPAPALDDLLQIGAPGVRR
eukprot:TRINITY_DN70008_c0_g1_i1.p1 TRINITY_DN70008_c0_g1~~TRINITY_DN70008_c0_g1_i1.p1  ORF type:complete len:1886 (+),score=473.69 TRINITY_DN70008_c0_g1_i1:180-5837(+)